MARVKKSTHSIAHYSDGGYVEKIGDFLLNGVNKAARAFESPEKKKAREELEAETAKTKAKLKEKCDGEATVYGKPYSPECKQPE